MSAHKSSLFNKYFPFSNDEFIDLLIASLFFGFMLSFRDWGIQAVSISMGLYAWVVSLLVFLLSYFIYLSVIKAVASMNGYSMDFRLDKTFLVIALFLTFMTDGNFVFLVPGGLYYNILKKHLLGKTEHGLEFTLIGTIGAVGAFTTIAIAGLFAPWYSSGLIFEKIVITTLGIAIFSMLPVKNNTGLYLLTSPLMFFTLLAATIILAVGAFLEIGLWYSLITALVAAIIAWVLTFKYLENK